MNTLLNGFLDNNSFFGKLMTKIGIIIAAAGAIGVALCGAAVVSDRRRRAQQA